MSVRLYVGNLPEDLNRQDLEAVFAEEGDSITTKIITDRKTNKCRGFGFITVKSEEQADAIIEKYNGHQLQDSTLKIERAQPRAKEDTPAPVAASGGRRNNNKGGGNNNGGKGRKNDGAADLDAVQPDPRWAQELEKLKQLLAAQATNS